MGVVRSYREDDFPALIALLNAVTAPTPAWTAAALRGFLAMPDYHALTDAFVVDTPDGPGLLGARDIRVSARGDEDVLIFESWGNVHPAARSSELGGLLMAAALRRASTILVARNRVKGIVQTRCAAADTASRATFAAQGLTHARDMVTMVRPDLGDLPEPRFPPGITVRPYHPGGDDAAWVAAFNEAFAEHWGGFMGMSPAHWAHYLHDPDFNPEISLVALVGDEIAGFCHGRIDQELNGVTGQQVGMIRYVGVRPRWRRGGLGAALTIAGLRALRAAGMIRATLGVDAENVTGAHRLYELLGFTITDRWVMYRREIEAAEGATQ